MLWVKSDLLEGLYTATMPTPWPRQEPVHYWMGSRCLKDFTKLNQIWYTVNSQGERIKIIASDEFLQDYLTEIALAHLVMNDGYWDKGGKTIVICTECFELAEIQRLIKLIEKKFGLTFTLNKRIVKRKLIGYRMRLSKKDVSKFIALIRPHMHDLYLFKLGPQNI